MQKPMLIAVNKSDREDCNFGQKLLEVQESTSIDCVSISAKEGYGLEGLIVKLRSKVQGVSEERVQEILKEHARPFMEKRVQ